MKLLLESLNYKSELDVNRRKLKEARSKELLFYIIAGFLLMLTGMVLISLRNKKRASAQKVLIHDQERLIAENELNNKQDELIKLSAHIVSKNDLLNSIEKDLDYYISLIESRSDKKVMEPLKKVIQSKIDDSSDWERFQNQFSAAYPKFVEGLSKNYPGLRTADIKLCCYLKMSMNTKEVAKVTGLSVRAVENKRYRLRKKLDLDTAISLDSFIHAFHGAVE
jgi:DNA-binding CsgD family transcriptional regulator